MILCANPHIQYEAYKTEIDQAVARVLAKGHYILGEEVRLFEEELARSIGVRHAVGVGNGTDALHIALTACGVGLGDEVITVSHTAIATVAAITRTGATAVLVDIDPLTYTMDPALFKAAITPKTKAVVVVHIYGYPADMPMILQVAHSRGIKVIEDCAQAQGAAYEGKRIGSFGDLACFSFYPTKNLGAIGDGGAIVTNDSALSERCKQLREYGWSKDRVSQISGWNSRLDEIQAAILRVKLPRLDQDNAKRQALAHQYRESLSSGNVLVPQPQPNAEHVFHLYVIRIQGRDELKKHLFDQGVQALIHYAYPAHQHPGFKASMRVHGNLTNTESIVKDILSLPMYPQLKSSDVKTVSSIINFWVKDKTR